MILFCVFLNFISANASKIINDDSEDYIPTINDNFDNSIVVLTLTSDYSDVNKSIVIEDFYDYFKFFIVFLLYNQNILKCHVLLIDDTLPK